MASLFCHIVLVGAQSPYPECCPNLHNLSNMAETHPELAMDEIRKCPLYKERPAIKMPEDPSPSSNGLPVVLIHGLTDSCFSDWMQSLTAAAGKKLGVYTVCIPTADNMVSDFINSLLMSLDRSVDIFTEKVRQDPKLKDGFNLVALSQGGLQARGYIERYNDPPVQNFLSIHGIVTGVASLPGCFSQGHPLGLVCGAVNEILGDIAYDSVIQSFAFPANDYRDPMRTGTSEYLQNSQLADLNNENAVNRTYVDNFGKTKRFAMVKALNETVVYPNEAEWWGQFADGSYSEVLTMEQTYVYQKNLFGLRAAHQAGKISFEHTDGDHMGFSDAQYYSWLEKYFASEVPISLTQDVVV